MLVSRIHTSGTSVISAYSTTTAIATRLDAAVGSTTEWAVLMPLACFIGSSPRSAP